MGWQRAVGCSASDAASLLREQRDAREGSGGHGITGGTREQLRGHRRAGSSLGVLRNARVCQAGAAGKMELGGQSVGGDHGHSPGILDTGGIRDTARELRTRHGNDGNSTGIVGTARGGSRTRHGDYGHGTGGVTDTAHAQPPGPSPARGVFGAGRLSPGCQTHTKGVSLSPN